MINFNVPPVCGNELKYISEAIQNHKICGDGEFTQKCHQWLENYTNSARCLLTTSCTHALEMAALLCDIQPGDEIIMPSYTFVSTANAFALRGARIVFVDIKPDTMNLDESKIEIAITSKTKAIVVVHYAGVACEMDTIMTIARKRGLLVIEDAAQGVFSLYNGKPLGSIGDLGCYSFHETKNYSMGEGGALVINCESFVERSEILREKGTNRKKYLLGQVDKYTWVDIGSSYLPSELNAAHLFAQLEIANQINERRLSFYNKYYDNFKAMFEADLIELPVVPDGCSHNAHMFFIKCRNIGQRSALIQFLKERDIQTTFHYVPLHSSQAGQTFGRFEGEDVYTTKESQRLLRLPIWYNMEMCDIITVIEAVKCFYKV